MNQAYIELSERWQELLKDNPNLRIRNAAKLLGISEAELLATKQGTTVTRLTGNFKELIQQVETLGKVMALTRNDAIVHEKTGQYQGVTIHGHMGLALGAIDLRIFFNRFVTGFAVSEQTLHGERHSLQFFDGQGEAVHKVYAVHDTHLDAFFLLVDQYRAADQQESVSVSPTEKTDLLKAPAELDIQHLEQDWSQLKDVHHFQAVLKKHSVERIPAYQAVTDQYARELNPTVFEAALTRAAAQELSIMLFVGSSGVIQIHTGTIANLKRTGDWFNVLDQGFNLHADTTQIAQAWVVRKPTVDGIVTSLEFYSTDGQQLALMFGERHNGEQEQEAWRQLVKDLEAIYERTPELTKEVRA